MKNSDQVSEIPNSHLYPSFVAALQEALWSEENLLKAVQKFMNSAVRADLRQALLSLDADIEQNIGKLRAAFKLIGSAPATKASKTMSSLLEQAENAVKTFEGTEGLDVSLIQVLRTILAYRYSYYAALVIYSALTGYEATDMLLMHATTGGTMIDLELEVMAMSYMVD